MSVLTRSVRGSSTQLLYHVLDEPQLMAAVRELPAPALVRLINHVGLEDAGELIALTSTQQLGQVFDAELWQAAQPGDSETFRPERFALFLRLLYEAGETFVVERLQAMPRELLTLAVHKLLLVIDIDALTVRFASAGKYFDDGMDRVAHAIDEAQFEEWEEFRLISRDPNAFEDLWNALLALDRENHELVRYVIERCCDMDGELIEESGLYEVLNDEELLENDLASERSERRAAQGFVAPADARAFLELARRETIDAAPDGRDPITRAYFRELATEQPEAHSGRALPAASDRRGGVQPDVGRLLSVLREAHVLDDEPVARTPNKLLGGPVVGGGQPTLAAAAARAGAKGKAARTQASRGAAKTEQRTPGRKGATAKGRGADATPEKGRRKQGSALAASGAVVADGAEPNNGQRLTVMAASMLVLREQDAVLHAQRTEELGFLANALLAGSRHDGRTYRPVEAIECALALCSIGLERVALAAARKATRARKSSGASPGLPLTEADGAGLLRELSADQLFRTGLYTLHSQVGEPARAEVARLLGVKLCAVPAAVSGGTASLVPQLELASADAVALAALAEPEPWLTGSLSAGDYIFPASQADVDNARAFLAAQRERNQSS